VTVGIGIKLTRFGGSVKSTLVGPAGWLLLLLSIVVLTVVFERIRFWSLWWRKRLSRRSQWLELLRGGGTPPLVWIEERDLEMRFAQWFLESVTVIAPLIGLIGTVLGLSQFLTTLGPQLVLPNGADLGGFADALLSTAFGLIVSLMATVAYHINLALRQRQLAIWKMDLNRSTWTTDK
jgi:biopolymer transport protein ExbB